MNIGTLTGQIELEDMLSAVLLKVDQRLKQTEASANSTMANIGKSMTFAAGAGAFLGTTLASIAMQGVSFAKNLISNSLMAGARLEQLGGVTRFLGERAGYTSEFIDDLAAKIEKSGITGVQSRDAIVQLLSAHIDLAKATELSAVAQNMATISGASSSETYARMVRGITTLQPELLKTAGFTVNLESAMRKYTETTGKSAAGISGAEKQQILLNAVLEEGAQKAGLYGLSMDYAGKQAGSAERAWAQVSERIGTAVLPVTTVALKAWYALGQAVRDFSGEAGTNLKPMMESVASSLQMVIERVKTSVTVLASGAKTIYDTWQDVPDVFKKLAFNVGLAALAFIALKDAAQAVAATKIFAWPLALLASQIEIFGFKVGIATTAQNLFARSAVIVKGAILSMYNVILAHPFVAIAAAIAGITLAYVSWRQATENAKLAGEVAAAQQDVINRAVERGANVAIKYADALEFNNAWYAKLRDPMTKYNNQLEENAKLGGTAAEKVTILSSAVFDLAGRGLLTGDRMKVLATRVQELRIPLSQLPPELRNIILGFEAMARAADIAASESWAEKLNRMRTEALTPLSGEVRNFITEMYRLDNKLTETDAWNAVKNSAGATEPAVKRLVESLKEGGSAAEAAAKKTAELVASFRGADKEVRAFTTGFAVLHGAELENFELQKRVIPKMEEYEAAGGKLTAGMESMVVAYQKNLVAGQERIASLAHQSGVTGSIVERNKTLGLSEVAIAKAYDMTADEMTQVLALQERELGNLERYQAFEEAARADAAAAAKRKADAFLLGNKLIGEAQHELSDMIKQDTMDTTAFQIMKIEEKVAKDIAAFDILADVSQEQKTQYITTAKEIADYQISMLNLSADTLEARLRKQSIFTKSEWAKQAANLKTTYDQMVASGKYGTDELVAQWKRYADAASKAGIGVGVSWRNIVEDVKGVLAGIPDLLVAAFTAGSDVKDAIKALGVQLVNAVLKNVLNPLMSLVSGFATKLSNALLSKFGGNALSSVLKSTTSLTPALAGAVVPGMIATAAPTVAGVTGGIIAGGTAAAGGMIGAGTAATGAGAGIGISAATAGITLGVSAAIIGGILLYKKLHKTETEKLGADIGRDLGVQIPKKMLESWEEESKQFGRQITTLLHIDEIIEQAGGLTAENIGQMTGRLRDTFVLLGQKQLTAAQATAILDKNFRSFVDAGTSKVGVLNAEIVELIKLNEQYGTQSKEMADYMAGQAVNAQKGFNAALGVTGTAYTELDKLKKDASKSDISGMAKVMDLRKKMEGADATQTAKYQKQIDAIIKKEGSHIDLMLKQQGVIDATKIHSQAAASAVAASLTGIIASNMNAGASFIEAARAAEPAVESLARQLKETGYSGGEAFTFIKDVVALAKDEIAGPALESIHGFTEGLVGMSNMGLMNQETFTGLTSQIAGTEASLIAQGFSGKTVHAAMQADVQRIWELQQQYNYTVDDSTQALINQMEAEGMVGEAHKSTTQQMIDASNRMVSVLEAMATFMGVTLPAAAKTGAAGVQGALDSVEGPELTIDPPEVPDIPDIPDIAADLTLNMPPVDSTQFDVPDLTADLNVNPPSPESLILDIPDVAMNIEMDPTAVNDLEGHAKNAGIALDGVGKAGEDAALHLKRQMELNGISVLTGSSGSVQSASDQMARNLEEKTRAAAYEAGLALEGIAGHIPDIPNIHVRVIGHWEMQGRPSEGGPDEGVGLSVGGIVPQYASVGKVLEFPGSSRGTDTTPAWLTPGERVLSVPETKNYDANQRRETVDRGDEIRVTININALDSQSVADAVRKPDGIADLFIREVANKKRARDKQLRTALGVT